MGGNLRAHNIVFVCKLWQSAAPRDRRLARHFARDSGDIGHRYHILTQAVLERAERLSSVRVIRYANFAVVQRLRHSFTLFYVSGHVNVSGTRRFARLPRTVTLFNLIFSTRLRLSQVRVVNSTASTLVPPPTPRQTWDLANLVQSPPHSLRISLRPHFFPAAVIRASGQPTLLWFANGRVVILRGRSWLHISEHFQHVRPSFLQRHLGSEQR